MLSPSDSIRMSIGKWPLPMITSETRDQEWFVSITEKLMWNAIIKVDRTKMKMAPLPSPSAEYGFHLAVLGRLSLFLHALASGCLESPVHANCSHPYQPAHTVGCWATTLHQCLLGLRGVVRPALPRQPCLADGVCQARAGIKASLPQGLRRHVGRFVSTWECRGRPASPAVGFAINLGPLTPVEWV